MWMVHDSDEAVTVDNNEVTASAGVDPAGTACHRIGG